jgi:4,5-DOPA dioxygenase extradiol
MKIGFAALRDGVSRPTAILVISAHWFVSGAHLTGDSSPRTIHDLSGLLPALHEVDYSAPGKGELARQIRTLLGEERASLSTERGIDHGTWSVFEWMYPEAEVPVVQLSIDRRLKGEATMSWAAR